MTMDELVKGIHEYLRRNNAFGIYTSVDEIPFRIDNDVNPGLIAEWYSDRARGLSEPDPELLEFLAGEYDPEDFAVFTDAEAARSVAIESAEGKLISEMSAAELQALQEMLAIPQGLMSIEGRLFSGNALGE